MKIFIPTKKLMVSSSFRRIFAFIYVIFIFLQLINCSNFLIKKNQPEVVNGVIDLRNWNFKNNGLIDLSGNWEFYKKKLLRSGNEVNDSRENKTLQYVPGSWNNSEFFNKISSGYGYGTYRLIILLNKKQPTNAALKILSILSSYTVFINGEMISNVGIVGKEKKSSIPGKKTGLIYFSTKSSKDNKLEITIQVSNFHHLDGGINKKIILGPADMVTNLREKNVTFEFFFFGAMVIMALYHIGIFSLNRDDNSLIYFGLLCFTLSLWIIISNEKVYLQFIPNINWNFSNKLESLSIYLSIPLWSLFLHSMCKKEFNKKILSAILVVTLLFILAAVTTSVETSLYISQFYHPMIILILIYTLYVLVKAFIKQKGGINILTIAFLFLLATIVMDKINNYSHTDVNHSLLLGFFILVFSNAYIVALKFTNAVALIEDLTDDLAETTIEVEKKNIILLDLNWNLEQKVKSRTEELENTLEKLEATNYNLTEVCKDLESAQEEAKEDLEMAIRVQRNFLPKKVPKSKNWEIAYHYNPMTGVSGDFYDFFVKDDEINGVGIFDVSGHGISSGLITTLAKSIIHRNFINNNDKKLNEILSLSNLELREELKEIFHYVTGVLLRLNDNKVEYVSAGHPEIIFKSNGVSKKVLNEKNKHISGSILGISNIDNNYEQITFEVSPGDFILLYTDGLIESSNKYKQSFETSILEHFNNAPTNSSVTALDYLLEKFYDFIDNKKCGDDITLIMLKKL